MEIFDQIGLDIGYTLIATMITCIILFIFIIILFIKQHKIKKKYNNFLSGADGKSLENEILTRFQEIEKLKKFANELKDENIKMSEELLSAFQKIGIVKYDAFKEMGGKLSFVLALLNKENDGFILNSMHSSREGCYTYVKEVIKGKSFVKLSEEENMALEEALNYKKYEQ